jgi:hypothetical protein
MSDEQVLCAIDGFMQVKLVPHIYRQEVYAGKDRVTVDRETEPPMEPKVEKLFEYQSPVNFFEPDLEVYPNFEEIERKYTVLLHEGDCIFIPAFYYHQVQGKADSQVDINGIKPTVLAISLRYSTNSALLNSFFKAIEADILN